jgi:hypothetical protein
METKKLSQEQLQQIKSIQQKNQVAVQELGQIQILKLQLQKREETAQQYLEDLLEEQQTIAQELEDTFGKGSINTETGEFTTLD